MEINDFRVATGQWKRSRQRCLSYLLKCACCRRGTGQTWGLMKGRQGSRLGIEEFLSHRATKFLDVSRPQEE